MLLLELVITTMTKILTTKCISRNHFMLTEITKKNKKYIIMKYSYVDGNSHLDTTITIL